MNNHLIYATSIFDAQAECKKLGLKFSQTTWLRGPEYLSPDVDYSGYTVHYTAAYLAAHPDVTP